MDRSLTVSAKATIMKILQRDTHLKYEPVKEIAVRDWAKLMSPEDLARMVAVAAAGHADVYLKPFTGT